MLFSRPDFSRLALKIVLERLLSSTPSMLLRVLEPSIRKEMALRTGFPVDKIPITAFAPDPQRKRILQAWIERHLRDAQLDPEWGRQAIACILDRKMDDDTFTAIHEILKLSCGRSWKAKSGRSRTVYLRRIGALFSAKKFPKAKVLFGLEITGFLQDRHTTLEKSFADVEETLEAERNQSRTLRRDLDTARQNLNGLQNDIQVLAKELKVKEDLLAAEKKRFESSETYWNERVTNQIARHVHRIKDFLEHEIEEAAICLDRPIPNSDMALSRIKNIKNYVEKMGAEQ
jgi:hypothetical protein